MITLTSAELLALRAAVEVAEPSADDAGPMEIWSTAMGAIKKIEDAVAAKVYNKTLTASPHPSDDIVAQKKSAPDPSWFGDVSDHPEMPRGSTYTNVHTCEAPVANMTLCGKPATERYFDGIINTEYYCEQHANAIKSANPDSATDCGWSKV